MIDVTNDDSGFVRPTFGKHIVASSTVDLRVFHFSGGRSSAKMVIDNYKEGDLVIFCDTEREDPKTYKFLNDFEAFENIPIIRLTMQGGWKGLLKKMKGIPNRAKRRCTIEMKIKTARRYLRTLGWIRYTQFVGFRGDERVRVDGYTHYWKKVKTLFPLYETKQSEPMINEYWNGKPYGLEIPKILSNCDLCFMKGEDKAIAILTNDISKADKWIEDEEDEIFNPNKYTYFEKRTMRQLKEAAQGFIDKGKVFDLSEMTAKFSCTCHA